MSSLTICHLADIHLGYRRYHRLTKQGFNQREVDVNLAFKEAVDRVIDRQPSATIIAGDLLHSVRPSNAIVTFCYRQLRRLAAGTKSPIILSAGNHESPRRSDSGSLFHLFSEVPQVCVATMDVETFTFPERELSVTCVPHAALVAETLPVVRADENFTYNVLVIHAQVDERLETDFGGALLDLSRMNPHEWDYIALGHVHEQRDVLLNAAYSGSIEHTAHNIWRGAHSPRGFLEVSLPEGTRVFHELSSPRAVVVLEPIDTELLDHEDIDALIVERVDSVPGGIDGKLVRLQLLNVKREVYRQLDHAQLRAYRSRALNFTVDVRPVSREEISRELAGDRRRSLREELEQFCVARSSSADGVSVQKILEHYFNTVVGGDEAS